MSQPASCLGDLGTHTGVTTSGAATVLIGGRPAARMGDAHLETPPIVTPFHGPQVIAGGSSSVLIEGKPAARANDLISCSATLIATQFTVLIG
ncbi:PAAR domain-containing protein (plasmid) [Deinococcus psychrotolerans]|uniref:PAAR domain-containing protein n=1 Tax=Deinococcus psychrotolerans TaxID=2489213 RepID=A0A3G8YI37_9DEIO|nr:PAAR domain-containing protein [Deinococcus psychrotolerans]AZI44510.1 PAAR domain-containing protein [Deinococcus psychrotolerans]